MSNNFETIQALGRSLSLDLKFDGEGVCELLVDDDSIVTLEGDPNSAELRINAVVGDLADPEDPQALRSLLAANYSGHGTGRNSLALDPVSSEVTLTRAVDVAVLGPAGLSPVLEEFVNYLAWWKKQLPSLRTAESSAAPASGAESFLRA